MPDEEKLIAASAKATVEALMQPITSLLDKLFGSAAEEISRNYSAVSRLTT